MRVRESESEQSESQSKSQSESQSERTDKRTAGHAYRLGSACWPDLERDEEGKSCPKVWYIRSCFLPSTVALRWVSGLHPVWE